MTVAVSEKGTLPALTGARAVAALLVYLHHFPPRSAPAVVYDLMREGHVGVTVFFVLSGFLITYRYGDAAQLSRPWLRRYFRNRVARIYPLFFLLTLLSFVATPITDVGTIVANLTLTKGLFRDYLFSAIPQSWSLTVEECFYASAPLIFVCMRARRTWIPFAAIPVLGLALVGLQVPLAGFMPSWVFMVTYTFFGRAFEFFCGLWLARWLRTAPAATAGPPMLTRLGVVGFGVSIAVMAAKPASREIVGALGTYGNAAGLLSVPGLLNNNLLLPLWIAITFAGLIRERSWLATLLGSRLFVLLGKSSYAFYLIHIGAIQQFLAGQVTGQPFVVFVLLVLVSIGLFRFVEEPLRHRLAGH